jgi:hypothetical protein
MLETGEKNNEESMSAQLYTITQRDGSIWGYSVRHPESAFSRL